MAKSMIAVALALLSLLGSTSTFAQSYSERAREARQWRTLDQRIFAPISRTAERTWNRGLDETIRESQDVRRYVLSESAAENQHRRNLETMVVSQRLSQGATGGTTQSLEGSVIAGACGDGKSGILGPREPGGHPIICRD